MKYVFMISMVVSVSVLPLATALAVSPSQELIQEAANSVICVFKDNVQASQVSGLAQGLAQKHGGKVRHNYTTVVKGFSATMSAVAADKMVASNPNIAYCEPNGIASGDAFPGGAAKGGGGGNSSGPQSPQITPQGITMVGGPVNVSGMGLTAWIIDSGIDLNNADLNVDVGRGANFVSIGQWRIDDGNGHGTHVAGTLAAIDNNIDVVGVAAGATVVPVRVLHNNNSGTYADILAGVDYVASRAQPGDVANMSIWGPGHSQSLHQGVMNLANIIPFITIAGNNGEDINQAPYEPAHVEHPNVYTVSAVDFNGNFTNFSNFGYSNSTHCNANNSFPCGAVDIAGPGQGIISLKRGGGTVSFFGTSMAAPHVAGVILLRGGFPTTQGTANNDPDGHPDPIVKY